ncbi:MAG TPA: NAD(P)H-dependent glycerol-3-phosphate dehydrogenase [Albidovulum sp.]|uniref:NAD(P)H-dependent glycerol-3-phosphate dehydrogenase n=1 Tax=Albidovulum sp. TaxID=1872424 RepID=UPI002B99B8AF|nr:NAD(P)H-dependent glycerol-3-phosphate dehydrogenase [Albidovulum sp.]
MSIGVIGSGAFGSALAVALAIGGNRVTLWSRDTETARTLRQTRENARYLPGVKLPDAVSVTAEMVDLAAHGTVLLAMPMQQMSQALNAWGGRLDGRVLVSCAKGIDLATGLGGAEIIRRACPAAIPALLTGPSFAADIARGLPTALTLACADRHQGEALQAALSTPVLRLYLTDDIAGAELGGALKNVIAIAAGVVIGAGLGDSARAALITRGFAEMQRLATACGAQRDTLAGLSGLGDLILTCTSEQSRNFRFGRALGLGEAFDPAVTVEGAATAAAAVALARRHGVELPVSEMVAALVARKIDVPEAMDLLLNRPLKREI